MVRPALRHPKPQDAPIAAERLSVLIHEMANLLDGSLRCLELARRQVIAGAASGLASRPSGVAVDRIAASDDRGGTHDCAIPIVLSASAFSNPSVAPNQSKGDVERRLDVVHAGMSHMVSLLREMSGYSSDARSLLDDDDSQRGIAAGGGGGVGRGLSRGVPTLTEAVRHAADVLEPVAADDGIRVSICLPPVFESLAARGMFGVVASAIRNSIEAIQQGRLRNGSHGTSGTSRLNMAGAEDQSAGVAAIGSIDIVGGTMDHDTRAWLEITDDGIGPATTLEGDTERFFELGYTTKTGSSGIGLAVARDTVTRLGGVITLRPRDAKATLDAAQANEPIVCRGAVLRIEWPISKGCSSERAGGGP